MGAIFYAYIFGYSKTANDILPFLYISVSDLVVCLSLYPLREVTCDYEHINLLAWGRRKLPHIVHSPFHEGPQGKDGSESLVGIYRNF